MKIHDLKKLRILKKITIVIYYETQYKVRDSKDIKI